MVQGTGSYYVVDRLLLCSAAAVCRRHQASLMSGIVWVHYWSEKFQMQTLANRWASTKYVEKCIALVGWQKQNIL